MGSWLDSGAAQTGEALSGAANNSMSGYVQGLQLKQQMQKQALEETQMRRALQNPHITALAHGAYLVQDPETGQITPHLAEGHLPGGPQNYLLTEFMKHPESQNILRAMGYVFGHNPDQMIAQTEALKALAKQRTEGAGANSALGELRTAQKGEVASNAAAVRGVNQARVENLGSGTQENFAQAETQLQQQKKLQAEAARTKAITEPDVTAREKAAEYNVARAERLRAQIKNDALLTPARKKLLEERAKASEVAAEKHREAASKTKKESENTVTIGMDALGRPYVKPTFKKPEDSKAFMNTYQQWTQPLKNLDIGVLDFESKAKKLSTIRKTWIEKNHPNEAEIAGFDQAMREAQ